MSNSFLTEPNLTKKHRGTVFGLNFNLIKFESHINNEFDREEAVCIMGKLSHGIPYRIPYRVPYRSPCYFNLTRVFLHL